MRTTIVLNRYRCRQAKLGNIWLGCLVSDWDSSGMLLVLKQVMIIDTHCHNQKEEESPTYTSTSQNMKNYKSILPK